MNNDNNDILRIKNIYKKVGYKGIKVNSDKQNDR